MKKIELAVICMLLLLVSCNKEETINTVSETPKYKSSYDLSTYDQIGINHNKGLNYLLSLSYNPSDEESFHLLNTFFGYEVDESLFSGNISGKLPQDMPAYFTNLEKEGRIKKHIVTQYFIDMYSQINSTNIFEDAGRLNILNHIKSIENSIFGNSELDEYEKMWLLGTASILRHSCEYWTNETNFKAWAQKAVNLNSKAVSVKDIYIAMYGKVWGTTIYVIQSDAFGYNECWEIAHSGWTGYSEQQKAQLCQNYAINTSKSAYLQ